MVLKKLNDVLFRISGVLSAGCLAGIVIITFTQVISRYFLHFAISWASELTVYLLIWMVFQSCSMGYRKGAIASLTLVTDKMPEKVQSAVKILAAVIMIFFMVVTFYGNIEIITLATGKRSSLLGLDMRLVYCAWSVAAVLMTLYALEKIWEAVRELRCEPPVFREEV